ncbi:hypothetical protein EDD86DRAFT_129751 [Gorgonomyces haynaldii]|nr:hypothetical protein EDD86DRAFT_129751 [Gorgonomyces haynaldii]
MINSKDAIDLFETLVIFEKFLKYCKPKIRQGWQRRSLLSLMESLMSKDNHHKLRKEGLRLLLYYMEDQPEDSKDATDVYASVLQCDVFEPHSLPHPRILSESLCIGEDESGLIAALKDVKLGYKDKKKQPLPQDRSNVSEKGEMNRGPIIARVVGDERAEESELLNMITNNLMTLAGDQARQEKPQDSSRDNDRPPVEHMWSLFREQYLKRWFPHIGTIKSGIEIGTVELSPCPQGILEILMGFIAKVVSKPKSETDWIQTLQRLLLEDEFNREYVHEIIRQSMMSRDIKEPVGAVTTWLLANPTEKPLFLSDPSNFRQLLSRYLKYVHLGTLSKEDKIETQYQALQLAVFTYREVAFERNFKLQERDWVLIMDILLEIHQRYLVSDDKMSLGAKVKDFARLIIDTMLGVWIRSKTQSADQWQLLAAAFRTCHHSMQHAKSWTQFFVPMTHTMAREVYQTVLVTATEKDVVRGKKRKDDDPKKDRPKVAHSSSAEKVKYGHTASTSDVKATTLVSSDEIPDDLECIWSNALSDMQWTSAESYFIWKELLCILGDLELYKTPKVHFEIVKCLVRLWDMLEPLTSSQERLPYDYSGMIFKATLSSTEFFESVAAAIGCVCRIMCKRVQLPFQSASVAFFYQLLERLLPSQNDTIIYSIVTHSQSIFTTGLPGVYILIPTYMTCIKWLVNRLMLVSKANFTC